MGIKGGFWKQSYFIFMGNSVFQKKKNLQKLKNHNSWSLLAVPVIMYGSFFIFWCELTAKYPGAVKSKK